jgi:hypothetical protein
MNQFGKRAKACLEEPAEIIGYQVVSRMREAAAAEIERLYPTLEDAVGAIKGIPNLFRIQSVARFGGEHDMRARRLAALN